MPRYVVLLRGVNVGGHNRLPMAEWRAALTADGFCDVRTLIQSGNAVLDAPGDAASLRESVVAGLSSRFGLTVGCVVLAAETFGGILAANPFPDADPRRLHLFFLAEPVVLDRPALKAAAVDGESLVEAPTHIWLHTPGGYGASKLAERLNRQLKTTVATARNLATCNALRELAGI